MEFKEIKPCTFYSQRKRKYILPVNPQDSDLSDGSSSDEDGEENVADREVLVEDMDEEACDRVLRKKLDGRVILEETDYEDNVVETEVEEFDVEEPEGEEQIVHKNKKRKTEKATFDWTENDIPFHEVVDAELEEIERVFSPLEYFCKFFTLDLMQHIVQQTNIYTTQIRGAPINLTNSEVTDFISILLVMGVIKLPALEDYWANETRISQIADIMPIRRFKKIRRLIHFNDNSTYDQETNKDRFFKVRPLVDKIRSSCRKFDIDTQFSVDETMVPYKGTFAGNLRQYIKSKPHKWGYKLFVRAGVSGIIYDFAPYQGSSTFDEFSDSLSNEEKEFGVGAKVVIALCKSIPNPYHTAVFFDNYFSSLDLLLYLKNELGIFSLGTFRSNRVGGCPMEADKILAKRDRGSYIFRSDQDKGVIIVKWLDNKCVLIGSTLCGIEPLTTVKRYSKTEKKKVNVNCPALIHEYNKHMGGVDKANSLLGLYRTPSRARRWYYGIFTYLLDMCVVNSWLVYKNDCSLLKKKPVSLKNFRMEVARSLRTTLKAPKVAKVRKNKKITTIQNPTGVRPDDATRRDQLGHWPRCVEKGRCRHCTQGFSRISCQKCDMRLCLTPKKNCFYDFHNA